MKKQLQLFMIFSLIFIVGCTSGGDSRGDSGNTFLGGNDGVSVEFKSLEPKTSFEKNELVDFTLLMRNRGEIDVPRSSIQVKLDGVKFEEWEGLDGDWRLVTSGINGVTKDFPEAQELEVTFGRAKFVGDLLSSRSVTFGAKACYPYKTKTDVGTCVSSKNIEEANLGEASCEISGEKVKSGSVSRGPVQVTSVTESFLGSNSIRFDIVLENEGEGIVVDKDVNCRDFDLGDTGVVFVRLPEDYKCTFPDGTRNNEGKISLQSGTRTLRCELEAAGNFEDRLIMDLDYKYVDTGSVTVEVNVES